MAKQPEHRPAGPAARPSDTPRPATPPDARPVGPAAMPGAATGPTGPTAPRPGERPPEPKPQPEGTGGSTPDGMTRHDNEPPQQPRRPDATTQGARPDVGGSRPGDAWPDDAASVAEQPTEDVKLQEARARSPSGNVFRVAKDISGFAVDDYVAQEDLPAGASVQRLMRLGCLEPMTGLKPDRSFGQPDARHLEEVRQMQQRVTELEDERDSAEKTTKLMDAEIRDLRADVARLTRERDEARKELADAKAKGDGAPAAGGATTV